MSVSTHMARPATKVSSGLFSTWVDYKNHAQGMDIEAVRLMINARTGNRYTPSRIHEFLHQDRAAPDSICRLINEDLEGLLSWLLEKTADPAELADYLELPIKKAP